MTCAKVHVTCRLSAADDMPVSVYAANSCRTPQTTCPRVPGEGYGPCASVCGQECHAEVAALLVAPGWLPQGATATVTFHRDDRPGHVCSDCLARLKAAGVVRLVERWGVKGDRLHRTTELRAGEGA